MDATIDTKNRADLLTFSETFTKLHNQLADVASRAVHNSNIQLKKDLLKDGGERVQTVAPQYVQYVKQVFDDGSNIAAVEQYNAVIAALAEAYKILVKAVKIDEGTSFSRIRELVKAITDLILNAKNLYGSSTELIQAISNDTPVGTRIPIAARTSQDSKKVVQNAQVVADSVTDPTIRRLILDSIKNIVKSEKDFCGVGQLEKLSANDKNTAINSFEVLMNSVQKILTAARTDAIDTYPIHLVSEVLNNVVDDMIQAAKDGDMNAVNDKASEVDALSQKLIDIMLKKAENTTDPNEKRYLLEAADLLKKSIADVLTNSKILAQDPKNIEAARKLQDSRNALRKAIDRARGVEGTPDGFLELPKVDVQLVEEEVKEVVVPPVPQRQFNFDFEELADDGPLLKAAKEQGRAALDVIREAEKCLSELDDPEKQRQIMEASSLVRDLAAQVVESARIASENPDDAKAQEDMATKQNELAMAIGKLLSMIGKGEDQNIANALKDLEDALIAEKSSSEEDTGDAALANNFFKIADNIRNLITSNFENGKTGDVNKNVETAREIGSLSTQANKALAALAKTVKSDTFKTQISNGGKIVADNALKLKILAAVKVSGGDDETGQVASAALGLKVQIEDIVSQLKAGFLRHRVQATARQTLALKKIAEAVRKARFIT